MKNIKLNRYEKKIEYDLLNGIYKPVPNDEFKSIVAAIAHCKKDAVLNIRVNSKDLENIKHKAKKLGLKYQTFISEIIHKKVAM